MKTLIYLLMLLCSLSCFAQVNTNGLITNQFAQFPQLNLPALLTNAVAYTPGNNATIIQLPYGQFSSVNVWMMGAGTNSSASGTATLAWRVGPDGNNWLSTLQTTTLIISGTNAEVSCGAINVSNALFMEIYWASNSDSTYSFPLSQVEFVPVPYH